MRKTYGKTQKRNSVKRGSGWVVLGKVFSANKGMFTARKSNLFIMFSSEARRCLWERGKVISYRRRERAEPKKSVASRRISRRCSLTALSLFSRSLDQKSSSPSSPQVSTTLLPTSSRNSSPTSSKIPNEKIPSGDGSTVSLSSSLQRQTTSSLECFGEFQLSPETRLLLILLI